MSANNSPLISIITPTYNRAATLETAIRSVYAQGIGDLEYIIMDGGSNDGTRELVSRYSQIQFVSQPDQGLYDAINKGISLARGKYIGLLNSDDYYKPNGLIQILDLLDNNKNIMGMFGSAEVEHADQKKPTILLDSKIDHSFLDKSVLNTLSINAALFHHNVFNNLNGFNTEYKIASDKDFLFRFGLNNYEYSTISSVIYVYREHETSITFGASQRGRLAGDLEEMSMSLKYYSNLSTLSVREICKKWHTKASADAALICLTQKEYQDFYYFSQSGIKVDKEWLSTFFYILILWYAHKYIPPKFRKKMRQLQLMTFSERTTKQNIRLGDSESKK